MKPNGRKEKHCSTVAAGLLVAAVGLGGCGGGSSEGPAVVHVGSSAIGKATVARWTRAIERGGTAGGFGSQAQGTARERALALLISAAWLRGEAAGRGLTPSKRTVEDALNERRAANGEGEFAQSLRASGQTLADVQLEVEAELEESAIRSKVLHGAPPVSEQEIADYYARHSDRFRKDEARDVELIENLPSPASARALVSRIGTGEAFTRRALREELSRSPAAPNPADIEGVTRAIFTAPQGLVSRPMSLNRRWAVFVVRKIKPPTAIPLSSVRTTILSHLEAQHRAQALAGFASEYAGRWTAVTSCRPGYVVPGCVHYTGPPKAGANPFAGG